MCVCVCVFVCNASFVGERRNREGALEELRCQGVSGLGKRRTLKLEGFDQSFAGVGPGR